MSWDDQYRFYLKVDKKTDDDCWEWQACRNKYGYGTFGLQSKIYLSNRIAYYIAYGEPGKQRVLHECNNPPCCNPKHLHVGTHQENMKKIFLEGRCERRGEFNPRANIYNEIATKVRKLHLQGIAQAEIARLIGIDKTAIWRIVNNQAYTNV